MCAELIKSLDVSFQTEAGNVIERKRLGLPPDADLLSPEAMARAEEIRQKMLDDLAEMVANFKAKGLV